MNAHPPAGPTVLRLTGRDALDVLQRISTGRLDDLEPGTARTTLFCDFRGRLLHRAVVARAGDAIWLLRDDAPGAELLAYVDRHVFREDVQLEDRSGNWSVHARWSADEGGSIEIVEGVPSVVPEGHGFRLHVEPRAAATATDPAALERERIARGRPRHGHEVHEDFNPYEIGCADEVHLAKGCYTGQEALQRLITYASVRRQPVLVRGRGAPPAAPCDLVLGEAPAGRLTSAATDAAADGWLGLAIVRREALASAGAGDAPAFAPLGGSGPVELEPFAERHPLGRSLTG